MYKCLKLNKLIQQHKRKRVELAVKNLASPNKHKFFSDEKKFQINSSTKSQYCTREKGKGYDKNKIQYCNTSSGKTAADVNIWTYIGPFGKGNNSFY